MIEKEFVYLFANVLIGRHEQADEDGNGTSFDHISRVLGGARGDVRQGPSSFKLQRL